MSTPAGSWPLAETGKLPDVESLVMDLLAEQVMVAGVPLGAAHVSTREMSDAELPFVVVWQAIAVGGLNPDGTQEETTLNIGTKAASRRESQMIRGEVRRVLLRFSHGGAHKGVFVDWAQESSAPGSTPEEDVDQRLLESGWTFCTRRHRGPTAYP